MHQKGEACEAWVDVCVPGAGGIVRLCVPLFTAMCWCVAASNGFPGLFLHFASADVYQRHVDMARNPPPLSSPVPRTTVSSTALGVGSCGVVGVGVDGDGSKGVGKGSGRSAHVPLWSSPVDKPTTNRRTPARRRSAGQSPGLS